MRTVPRNRERHFIYPPAGAETVPADYDPGYIQVFDSGTDDAPSHGELGPTHCARFLEPEYPYQLEMMLDEVAELYPDARRAIAPDGRRWKRAPDGRFEREGPATIGATVESRKETDHGG